MLPHTVPHEDAEITINCSSYFAPAAQICQFLNTEGSPPPAQKAEESSRPECGPTANWRQEASYLRVIPKAEARPQAASGFQAFAGEAMDAASQGFQ